jgi:hypothetical protein
VIFNLFGPWTNTHESSTNFGVHAGRRRASIARGEVLFNSKPINITDVAGLNDELNLAVILGTCGTCHDSPNVGNHSLAVPLNIGVGDLSSSLDLSYLPVFTLQNKTSREIKITTDPGRALITGSWKDVGKVKGPVLRGACGSRTLFSQRFGGLIERCARFLREALQYRIYCRGKRRLNRFPECFVASITDAIPSSGVGNVLAARTRPPKSRPNLSVHGVTILIRNIHVLATLAVQGGLYRLLKVGL